MATSQDGDEAVEEFLSRRGHDEPETWDRSYNKRQCPDCGALHDDGTADCSVCGWAP